MDGQCIAFTLGPDIKPKPNHSHAIVHSHFAGVSSPGSRLLLASLSSSTCLERSGLDICGASTSAGAAEKSEGRREAKKAARSSSALTGRDSRKECARR